MKKRDMNLEFIRVLSCIFVILLHVSNYYRRNLEVFDTSYVFAVVVNVITRISVPMFFMISGALLMNRKITFGIRRIKNALIPLLFWSLVYGFWEILFKSSNVYEVVDVIYDPVTKHLWYMYVMIGIYIALPYMQTLYQNLEKQAKRNFLILWFAILLFTYVSSFFGQELAYEIPFIGGSSYYFGYFMLGAYLYEYKLDINKFHSGIGSVVFLTYLCIWALMSDTSSIEKVLYYKNFFIVIASACTFHRILMMEKIPVKDSIINAISKCSLGIYYGHIIVLDLCKRYLDFLEIHSIIGVILITALVFITTYIAIALYNTYKQRKQSLQKEQVFSKSS